jgi:two-component sensor histidine kinase
MSHELRTPLNAILGFSQLLARDQRLDREQQNSLSTINREGEHLLRLVNNILELARLEASALSVNPETVDLPQLFQDMAGVFRASVLAKGLVLTVAIDELPRQARLDAAKLRQVLLNLLSNALKFTSRGSIQLRAWVGQGDKGTEDPLPPSVPLSPCSRLLVEVKDTGVGIAPGELEQLFLPFSQTEAGRRLGQGTGLGLAITQQLIHLLGGRIEAESVPGQGSVFRFVIPLEDAEHTPNSAIQNPNEETEPGDFVSDFAFPLSENLRNGEDCPLSSTQLQSLPEDLLRDLRHATRRCDPEQLARVVDQIRPLHQELAENLDKALDKFAFHSILGRINQLPPSRANHETGPSDPGRE